MHEILIEYMNRYLAAPVAESEISLIKSVFRLRKIRKRQFFLEQGDVCRQVGFILKGAMRQFSIDENGRENVVGLFLENWWVGDRESFSSGTPATYFIDAWDDSELLTASKEDFDAAISDLPSFEELRHKLIEKQNFTLLRRVSSAISLSAEQRYADLEKNNPEFISRFPQHVIASYLGMTKETLSRVRGSALRK